MLNNSHHWYIFSLRCPLLGERNKNSGGADRYLKESQEDNYSYSPLMENKRLRLMHWNLCNAAVLPSRLKSVLGAHQALE